jgi:integrase
VYFQGQVVYLGAYNSKESKEAYKRIVADWSGTKTSKPVVEVTPADTTPVVAPRRLTVAEVLIEYRHHVDRYYKSREVDNLGEALKPLRAKFGYMPIDDFGPLQLRVLRNTWIEADLARNTINARVIRIRRFFRWAVSRELVNAGILLRLNSVESLMPGRGGKETSPKLPVSWETVEATLPYLPEMVRAMVLFGWHSGARPAEITNLTTGMIDQSRDVWIAKPERHKTQHYGHVREILIGRSAQQALMPWLRPEEPDEPIFSPQRVDNRQVKRLKGKRAPGRSYSRAAFQQTIRRACRRGGVPEWSPNALRHAYSTRLRDEGGIEAAQMALGHAKPDTSLIYTSAAKGRAMEVVRRLG